MDAAVQRHTNGLTARVVIGGEEDSTNRAAAEDNLCFGRYEF